MIIVYDQSYCVETLIRPKVYTRYDISLFDCHANVCGIRFSGKCCKTSFTYTKMSKMTSKENW